MTLVTAFVRLYWKQLTIIVVVCSIVIYVFWLRHQVAARDLTIASLTSTIAGCKLANEQFAALTKSTTESVDRLAKFTEEQQYKMSKLGDQLIQQQSAVNDKVVRLLNAPRPQTCEESIRYLIDGSQEYVK